MGSQNYAKLYLDGEDVSPEHRLEHVFEVVRGSINQIRLLEHRIENQGRQKNKFLKQGDKFTPEPEFREFEHDINTFISLIEETKHIAKNCRIEAKAPTEAIRNMVVRSLEELKWHARLMDRLGNPEEWKTISQRIWGKPSKSEYKRCKEQAKSLDTEQETKTVSPRELKKMFDQELEELGIDYDTAIEQVRGSHNLPGERRLVVSSGANGERMYSQEEAEALTKHETFHVARAHNGYKISSELGTPPFFGVFTEGYDVAEEGGAVYREIATNTLSDTREHDYRAKVVAAYLAHESSSFSHEFTEIADKLEEIGLTRERAFEILFRNRQAIRHHTYWCGRKIWQSGYNQRLLIGKVNKQTAESFAGSRLAPDVGANRLFPGTKKKKENEV